ncbi:MAG: hypothetical protein Q9225_006056 [Loekoesia sp. 1 TL-2023]
MASDTPRNESNHGRLARKDKIREYIDEVELSPSRGHMSVNRVSQTVTCYAPPEATRSVTSTEPSVKKKSSTLTIACSLIALVLIWVLGMQCYKRLFITPYNPPIGEITQGFRHARDLAGAAIVKVGTGHVPTKALVGMGHLLNAFQAAIIDSKHPHQTYDQHLLGYNKDWVSNLASLQQDLENMRNVEALTAAEAAMALFWPRNPNRAMHRRLHGFSVDMTDNLARVESSAHRYNENLHSLEECLDNIDNAIGNAASDLKTQKYQMDFRASSQYLGMNRQEAERINAEVMQFRRADERFCEAKSLVGSDGEKSTDTIRNIGGIRAALSWWTERCWYDRNCQGLLEEMRRLSPLSVVHTLNGEEGKG